MEPAPGPGAPGHYGRRAWKGGKTPPFPKPTRTRPDRPAAASSTGRIEDRLDHWLTLVQQGQVIEAYRVFLGLFEERERRRELFAQLAFAGLIDVQDRMLYNRSYTTGHKSYRARATIELGNAIGWDDARDVIYAGVLDMAVGPRWHANYEMACQVSWIHLADEAHRNQSSLDPSPSEVCEARLLDNQEPLTPAEARELIAALTRGARARVHRRDHRAAARGQGGAAHPRHHADRHRRPPARDGRTAATSRCPSTASSTRTRSGGSSTPSSTRTGSKLLYVAGSFINQAAHWLRATPGNGKADTRAPQGAAAMSAHEILTQLDAAQVAMKPPESVAWTRAYLDGGHDRGRLVGTLALAALKHGNDTHNQEIALCLLDDYRRNPHGDRERLLLACAQHTAGHQKYGDTLEPYRRYLEALGLSEN